MMCPNAGSDVDAPIALAVSLSSAGSETWPAERRSCSTSWMLFGSLLSGVGVGAPPPLEDSPQDAKQSPATRAKAKAVFFIR